MIDIPSKALWKVRAVAEFFDVTMRTVRNWIEEGEVETIRIPGGGIRISRASIEKILLKSEKN